MLLFITFLQLLLLKLQLPEYLIFSVLCMGRSVIFAPKKQVIWNLSN